MHKGGVAEGGMLFLSSECFSEGAQEYRVPRSVEMKQVECTAKLKDGLKYVAAAYHSKNKKCFLSKRTAKIGEKHRATAKHI